MHYADHPHGPRLPPVQISADTLTIDAERR